MENIIKKAIEGGWKPKHLGRAMALLSGHAIIDINFATDPSFWQSLGKACGWSEKSSIAHGNYDEIENISYEEKLTYVIYALCFHEKNLTEGWDAAVKWLSEIICK